MSSQYTEKFESYIHDFCSSNHPCDNTARAAKKYRACSKQTLRSRGTLCKSGRSYAAFLEWKTLFSNHFKQLQISRQHISAVFGIVLGLPFVLQVRLGVQATLVVHETLFPFLRQWEAHCVVSVLVWRCRKVWKIWKWNDWPGLFLAKKYFAFSQTHQKAIDKFWPKPFTV